jgi:hypothetical protein
MLCSTRSVKAPNVGPAPARGIMRPAPGDTQIRKTARPAGRREPCYSDEECRESSGSATWELAERKYPDLREGQRGI